VNQTSDITRLTAAVSELACAISEVLNEKLQGIAGFQAQRIAHKMMEPMLTRQQVAELLQVESEPSKTGLAMAICRIFGSGETCDSG